MALIPASEARAASKTNARRAIKDKLDIIAGKIVANTRLGFTDLTLYGEHVSKEVANILRENGYTVQFAPSGINESSTTISW